MEISCCHVVVGVEGVRQSLMAQTQSGPAHRTTFRSVVLGMSA